METRWSLRWRGNQGDMNDGMRDVAVKEEKTSKVDLSAKPKGQLRLWFWKVKRCHNGNNITINGQFHKFFISGRQIVEGFRDLLWVTEMTLIFIDFFYWAFCVNYLINAFNFVVEIIAWTQERFWKKFVASSINARYHSATLDRHKQNRWTKAKLSCTAAKLKKSSVPKIWNYFFELMNMTN